MNPEVSYGEGWGNGLRNMNLFFKLEKTPAPCAQLPPDTELALKKVGMPKMVWGFWSFVGGLCDLVRG